MKHNQFYGIWIYGILCLLLAFLYKNATGVFEINIANYNLSLWSALGVNVFLIVYSILTFRESKIMTILGIIPAPLSIYLFYNSWTKMSYEYLAGFLAIPIILLLVATLIRPKPRQRLMESMPAPQPQARPLPRT
jgi:hypothetical protein